MGRVVLIEDMPPEVKGRARDLAGVPIAAPVRHDGRSLRADDQGALRPFEADLYPNRSLPLRGLAVLLGIMMTTYAIVGGYFLSLGAWPVLGFCGLDVLLVYGAFHLSYRQGRLRERVRVDGDEVSVSRILPSGHESRWRLQGYWTSINIDRPVRHESQLVLRYKGRNLILGGFLSPPERLAFADALRDAIMRHSGRSQATVAR